MASQRSFSSTSATPVSPQPGCPHAPAHLSATYHCLRHYIADRMRMSHVCQPLMLIELLELCRQRLDAFREQRGEEVFAHRSPINGSVK